MCLKWRVLIAVFAISVVACFSISGAEEDIPPQSADPITEDTESPADPRPVVSANIDVIDALPQTPAITILHGDELHSGQAKDAGDLLRAVPGVSSGRMGGHGLDPRVRGLGESSIRVLVDGAEIHGGCPNRMDPPSSFAAVDSYDSVTVLRGIQTLRFGTAPGTILFERQPVRFLEDGWWQISADAVTGSYNDGPALGFNAAVGTPRFSVAGAADRLAMDNYSDGNGEEVASSFDSRSGLLTLGWTPNELTALSLSYEANRTEDALQIRGGPA